MADGGYRGISLEQDSVRWSNKDKVLLKKLEHTFPAIYSSKVDMRKVNTEVLRPWIADKTTELLGFEDDVVTEYAMSLLEDTNNQHPDPRKLQISLTGFLEGKAPQFMTELWTLLLSAQESIGGIPKEFVEAKKRELQQQREQDEQVMREVSRRGGGPIAGSRGKPSGYRGARSGFSGRGPPASFKDKHGNMTERSRDSGWGPRGASAPRSPPRGGDYGGNAYDRQRNAPSRYYDHPPDHHYRRDEGRGDQNDFRDEYRYESRDVRYFSRDYRRRSPSPEPRRREERDRTPPMRRRSRDASPRASRDVTPPMRRRNLDGTPPMRGRSASQGRSPSRSVSPGRGYGRNRSRSSRSPSRSVSPPRRRSRREDTPDDGKVQQERERELRERLKRTKRPD